MGKKIKPIVLILAICGVALFIMSYLNLGILTEKYFSENKQEQAEQVQITEQASILDVIENYQKKYFDIVTKNDVLLISEHNDEIEKDGKELSKLFDEVKSKINPQNPYLIKLNNIEKKYSENKGNNTFEINQFAEEHYKAVDDLLNEVYLAVKSTLTDDEAADLTRSEIGWLNKVEAYGKHFESMDYGTIAYIVKTGYECNMRSFRTLLLMLYLN